MFGTHTPRQRQTGSRPSPTTRLCDPSQPLITWSPSLPHTPRGGWGVVIGTRILNPRSISPAINLREGAGVRGEEGLCIFLYLWQTAVLAWFKLPTERSTSLRAGDPEDAGGATSPGKQPANQPLLWLGCPFPITRHPVQDGGPHFHQSVVSKITESAPAALPTAPPSVALFSYPTAQPPLTGCENTTKDN